MIEKKKKTLQVQSIQGENIIQRLADLRFVELRASPRAVANSLRRFAGSKEEAGGDRPQEGGGPQAPRGAERQEAEEGFHDP